ncbi:MAG TPA: ABC transporter permease subunit/CPBP intramembrane protease [Gemmataceae bacterium]|nr:ABC transporter permease subunit/CPBP intramembrane protease [Gemmataceae bacterium]
MSDIPHLSFTARFRRLSRLVRKETTGVLRDRRTLLTLFLMPLLLYPLLAIGFRQFFLSQQADQANPIYRLGFRDETEAFAIMNYLNGGRETLTRLVETNGGSGKELQPRLQAFPTDDLEEDIQSNDIDLGIRPRRPGGFAIDLQRELNEQWELLYREDSSYGQDAARYIERLVSAGNELFLRTRLNVAGIRQSAFPVTLSVSPQKDSNPSKSGTLAILIPLILILMTITGGVYPAIDLTAGERERGTLEILMAAPVPRLALLFAKYVAVLTVALLTAVVNLGTMMVTLIVSGLGPYVFHENGLSAGVLFSILGLLVLFAGFFSAVLLALCSFARSFKEAQAYLIPLMLVSMGPGMLSLVPGVRLHGFLIIAPLINIVLLARDVLQGQARMLAAVAVILCTSLYALAALALAARLFGAEAVLFTDQGSWGDLWRRPKQARSRATPTAAFFCLALLFPAYFVTTGGGTQLLQNKPLETRFVFMSLSSIVLFAGFPVAAAYMGRVRLVSGLQLSRPSVLQVLAGVLLGLGLWPAVHELTMLVKSAGLSTLSPEIMDRLHESFVGLRLISPLWPVIAIGIIPPLVEELFFRGYLLAALLSTGRPIWAITASALLFGLFHLLVLDYLAIERFIPTTLLGLLLAWITWKTGTIWPGVAMHVTHNTLLTLMGYYEPTLEETGWVPSADKHLPPSLYACAAVLVAVAALGLWWSCRGARGERRKAKGER